MTHIPPDDDGTRFAALPASTPETTPAAANVIPHTTAGALPWLATLARPWHLAAQLPLAELHAIAGLSPLQVQLLYNRGVRADAATYLAADWRVPGPGLPGMEAACARMWQSIQADELITVYGDYDADGMTSCAILLLALRALGAHAEPYIPHREDDGRGLTSAAVRALAAGGTRLIVTSDCGMASGDEANVARALGVAIIVTDHHPPQDMAPDACAFVNPLLAASPGALADLAGAGVAFRVAQALLTGYIGTVSVDAEAVLDSLLDLAAIGTIADVAPLTAHSWLLARAGLRRLRTKPRAGMGALMARAGIAPEDVGERDIAYALAPRLNAAARLGDPLLAVRLLLTDDPAEAPRLAGQLDQLNSQRQIALKEMLDVAHAQALPQVRAADSVLVVGGDDWSPGMIGLVASRLAEEFHRPAFAISRGANACRGSARGPEGVNLVGVLAERADLFRHFGGHRRAAGFTVETRHLAQLEAHLRSRGATLDGLAATGAPVGALVGQGAVVDGALLVDCRLPLRLATAERYLAMRELGPFGAGFAEPCFLSQDVRLVRCWRSGMEGQTLRLALREGECEYTLLWPRHGELCDVLRAERDTLPSFDVIYTLDAYRPWAEARLRVTPRVLLLLPQRHGVA